MIPLQIVLVLPAGGIPQPGPGLTMGQAQAILEPFGIDARAMQREAVQRERAQQRHPGAVR